MQTQSYSLKHTPLASVAIGMILSMLFTSNAYAAGNNKVSALFDGQAGEFMTRTSPTGLPTGADARTVEAWVKTTTNTDLVIMDMGNAIGGTLQEYEFFISGGQLWLALSGARVIWDTPNVSDGNWHHLAVSYAGGVDIASGMTAYMDGVPLTISSSVAGIPNTTNEAVRIGASLDNINGTALFVGAIDEVRVWNTARTNTQINNKMNKELTGNETGLVGYWNFDNKFQDATVNGNDVTSAFKFKHFKSNDTPF